MGRGIQFRYHMKKIVTKSVPSSANMARLNLKTNPLDHFRMFSWARQLGYYNS